MNSKALKLLRCAARDAVKSKKMSEFEKEEYMRKAGVIYGASHKQVKRAVRVVVEQIEVARKPRANKVPLPAFARALHFVKTLVMASHPITKRSIWRNMGLHPV
jgi:hypothetical protein